MADFTEKSDKKPSATSQKSRNGSSPEGEGAIQKKEALDNTLSSWYNANSKPGVQAKLEVSSPDDAYEQEADAVADKVAGMSGKSDPAKVNRKAEPVSDTFLQRQNEEEEEPLQAKLIQRQSPEEEELIQPKGMSNGLGTPNNEGLNGIEDKLNNSSGQGSSLPDSTKASMEGYFGANFSQVRVHSDSNAVQMSKELNAQAFTHGNDIYFNSGKYNPDTPSGQHLLAHELTHTIQQKGKSSDINKLIQRDLSVEPTVANPTVRTLTDDEIATAIGWNSIVFTDADEIALIRDVIGLSQEPAVINADFVKAIASYQASFGLTQDGMVGANTALKLANELQGEANYLGSPDADTPDGTEMALNPAQRRMRLRSRVAYRLGILLHQGFVGNRLNPQGIVTVRSGVNYQSMCGPGVNCANGIQVDYTGNNADDAHWLQFMSIQMYANDPTTGNRVYIPGSTTGSGGNLNYSNNTATSWAVDSASNTNPYYEAGFTNTRTPGASTSVFDQPQGWNGVADAFAATFTSRPATATLIFGFDTRLIVNNRCVYFVRWNIRFDFNTAVTPTADVPGSYSLITAGSANGLPTALKTVLDARYPGNAIN